MTEEDYYQYFRAQGMSDKEARANARMAFKGDQDAAAKEQEKIAKVWIPGSQKKRSRRPGAQDEVGPGTVEVFGEGQGELGADSVRSWVYDNSKLNMIVVYLAGLGFDVTSFDNIEKAWSDAVDRASLAYMASGKKLKKSPWDMLALSAPFARDGEDKKKNFPWKGEKFSETTTTTNIADMAPETARAVLERSLSELLGRGPTEEEIEDFASRANAIVSANPQVTENTTQYEWDPEASVDEEGNPVGGYRQSATTSRQVGPSAEDVSNMVSQEARDEAMENPEYGAYQAAGPMFNALLQAIMSPVSGG